MGDQIKVDPRQLATFVGALFRYAEEGSWASLRAFRDDKEHAPAVEIRGVRMNGDPARIVEEAAAMAGRCAELQYPAVFCPPVATFNDPDKATEAALADGLALSVELDRGASRARRLLEALLGEATVVVASGGTWANPKTSEAEPKLHLHWRLTEPTRTPEDHALLKRARSLATAVAGGDASNKTIVHPIRWPGSVHRKGEPRLCQIVEARPEREIDLQEAIEALEGVHVGSNASDSGGRFDASTHDFMGRMILERQLEKIARAEDTAEVKPGKKAEGEWRALLIPIILSLVQRRLRDEEIIAICRRATWLRSGYTHEETDKFVRGQITLDRATYNRPEPEGEDDDGYTVDSEKSFAGAFPQTLLRDLKPCLDRRELIRGCLPAKALGVAYAEPGAGKTAAIVDMGLHVAAGLEYRGRRVEQQPVIFVALEGHAGIGNRVYAAARELGIGDAPFVLITASDNFRDPVVARRVALNAKELGGEPLVIIDTLTAALAGGSDCDPADVGALIEAVKRELMAQGCTTLIIHHTGKDASRGARGWSGLLGACDFEFEMSRDDELRTLRVSKMRDGGDNQPAFCYQLYPVELGKDRYGEAVTAVCVEHLADADAAKRGKRLTPKARAALNCLWECIKDPGRSFPLPEDIRLRCVLLSVWEGACIAPGAITKAVAEKERRRKFKEAKAELEGGSEVVCDGEGGQRVYPTPKKSGGVFGV